MAWTTTDDDTGNGFARLQAVQSRLRSLARSNDVLAYAMRQSLAEFYSLVQRYNETKDAMAERKMLLARDVLAQGYMFDPAAKGSAPSLPYEFPGLCPAGLAACLARRQIYDLEVDLQRTTAAAALEALNVHMVCQRPGLTREEAELTATSYRDALAAGTHVEFFWMVGIARPADWEEPADPASMRLEDLKRFGDDEYRTIALYYLSGLADVGLSRPIVPEPPKTGDRGRDFEFYVRWRFRFPNDRSEYMSPTEAHHLSPELAEEMLAVIEGWLATAGGDQGNGSGMEGPDSVNRGRPAAGSRGEQSGSAEDLVELPDEVTLPVSDLAKHYRVDVEALRKRLERWRDSNPGSDGFVEIADATSRSPKILYRVGAVRHIICKLIEVTRPSGETSGERPAKTNLSHPPQ